MDMRTGKIYNTLEEAQADGVPEEFIIQGTKKALDNLIPRLKFPKGVFKTIKNIERAQKVD